jgi:hypothetical protein
VRVLVGCEFSGIVRDAFTRAGHWAVSCDLLPTETVGAHHQGDLLEILDQNWDLAIFHPPCTYFTNSGVCHLHKDPERWNRLDEAAEFFNALMEAPIEKTVIENPIPHKYAVERIERNYDQIIQPWMFGHKERKATCLWLKNLPKLQETDNVKEEMLKLPKKDQQRVHYLSPGPDRWKERSRTFTGIAEAMAEQWGLD